MDWTSYATDQGNAEYGSFLIAAVADPLGLPHDPTRIDRAVYKNTDCGAWIRFDEQGIKVGTIVEGSDAEYSERIDLTDCDTTDDGAALVNARVWEALQRCEDFANEYFDDSDWRDDLGSVDFDAQGNQL